MPPQARQQAIQKSKSYLSQNPIFLDTETTGFKNWDEIVEIAIVDQDGNTLLDSLVKPGRKIPPDAMAIHGITEDMVADAPTWTELWPQVQAALEGRVVGIYNADFDLRLLEQTASNAGMVWEPPYAEAFCVMNLYSEYKGDWNNKYRNYRWHKLEAAGRQLGIPLPNAHRALADTLLARKVLQGMATGE